MSLTLNMVGGGGGKLKDTDAVLIVTVPTGSTVTATKGGTTLTPTMWVKAADASLDCAIFSIPASQFDSTTPWTITATDGTSTASTTVLITTNKEYEVTISYRLYIIKAGEIVIQPTITGGTLTAGNTYAVFDSNGNAAHLAYVTVDVSNYDVLSIDIASGSGSYSYSTTPGIGLSLTQPTISASTAAVSPADAYYHMVPDSASFQTVPAGKYTADISQFGGNAFVWIALSGMRTGDGILNIENFYLE